MAHISSNACYEQYYKYTFQKESEVPEVILPTVILVMNFTFDAKCAVGSQKQVTKINYNKWRYTQALPISFCHNSKVPILLFKICSVYRVLLKKQSLNSIIEVGSQAPTNTRKSKHYERNLQARISSSQCLSPIGELSLNTKTVGSISTQGGFF